VRVRVSRNRIVRTAVVVVDDFGVLLFLFLFLFPDGRSGWLWLVKGHLRLTGVQVDVGRSLNDVWVRRVGRVDRVRWVVLAELSVVTPPGIFVVRSAHD
jgi:hypothetical protein